MTIGVDITERSRRTKAIRSKMVRGVAGFSNMVEGGGGRQRPRDRIRINEGIEKEKERKRENGRRTTRLRHTQSREARIDTGGLARHGGVSIAISSLLKHRASNGGGGEK